MRQFSYQLKNIRFFYDQQLALSLDNVAILDGKMTALLGDNGSGKSTLLNILAFLTLANAGQLFFKGKLIRGIECVSYRRRVGFLAQKPFMFGGTVYDNVYLGLKIQAKTQFKTNILQILGDLNIEHLAQHPAKLLSGGELQKVALARILVLEPEVLLLDEPFSYLDQGSAQNLECFLREYCKNTGRTLIFSTHNRLQGLALADEIVALSNGYQIMSPLINLFQGKVIQQIFYSEHLQFFLANTLLVGNHVSIDPQDIVLSTTQLVSSMRNQFQGQVNLIAEESGRVCVNVDAGEIFQVLITYQALADLSLELGKIVWVNFKSNAVVVF